MEYILIIIASVFISNIVLSNLVGFSLIEEKMALKDVIVKGSKLVLVAFLATVIMFPVYDKLLKPESWQFLLPLTSVLVIIGFSLLVDFLFFKLKIIEKTNTHDFILPLNAAVIVIVLLVVAKLTYLEALFSALGLGLGYLVILVLMLTIKPKLDLPGIPKSFKGIPIMLITLGLLGLIFVGLRLKGMA